MKVEKTPKITSLSDYRKTKKIKPQSKYNKPAKITSFEVLCSLHSKPQEPMDKEEVRSILAPNTAPKSKQQNQPQSTGSFSSVVDFDVLASLFPNINKSKESELVEFFIIEGYNLTYEQAGNAIKNYMEDANLAKPVFNELNRIFGEFEERIKGLDLSEMDKIRSIYEKKDKREMIANFETPDNFIPSKKSSRVTKNIAKLYVEKLSELLPDYEIEVAEDGTSNSTNNMTQISVSKDNYYMLFFFNDFISTIKNGKVNKNVQCYIETPKNEKFNWHYDGPEEILNKINKIFRGTVGAISRDSYNEKGEAEFYVDASFNAGPAYYGLLETMRNPEEEKHKVKINNTEGMSKQDIDIAKNLADSDPEVNKYYKQYGLIFVNSCIRDGVFNVGVATAQSLLIELGQYFAKDGEISFDYVKEIIDHIEKKDNDCYIDEDIFDIANNFIIKELNSNENHHDTVFKMLDYVSKHHSQKVFDFADNLADELFSFEEVDEILKMLENSTDKRQAVIIQKVNKLVRHFDESGALKPDIRIFDQLKHELHLQ